MDEGESISKEMEPLPGGGGGAPDLCFTPSIHHITEDARKLLRPPGSLASDRLSSQPAQCGGGGGGISKHKSTEGKLCEVPTEHTLSGQGDC